MTRQSLFKTCHYRPFSLLHIHLRTWLTAVSPSRRSSRTEKNNVPLYVCGEDKHWWPPTVHIWKEGEACTAYINTKPWTSAYKGKLRYKPCFLPNHGISGGNLHCCDTFCWKSFVGYIFLADLEGALQRKLCRMYLTTTYPPLMPPYCWIAYQKEREKKRKNKDIY